ncbi:MAG: ribosomal protein L7/L12 [Myxococcaceae bacterium]
MALFALLAVGLVLLVVVGGLIIALAGKRGVEVVTLQQRPPGTPQLDSAEQQSPEQLLRAGRKIEAIKRYRELTGVGLREAKDAVEALERGQSPDALPPKGAVLRQVTDSEIEAQIRSGHLIDAIKLYREKTGVGLKEAKDAVEALRDRMRAS